MKWSQISGFLRHALTFLGGWVIAQDWGIDAETYASISGGLIAIVGVIWSMFTKTDKAEVKQAATLVNVPAVEQAKVGIEEPLKPSGAKI